jgi:hypothetical protein
VHGHCAICATALDRELWTCSRCQTPHHADCAQYFGGCAIFGCRDGSPPEKIERESWPAVLTTLRRFVWVRRVQRALALYLVSPLLILPLYYSVEWYLRRYLFWDIVFPGLYVLSWILNLMAIVVFAFVGEAYFQKLNWAVSRGESKELKIAMDRRRYAIPTIHREFALVDWIFRVSVAVAVLGFLLGFALTPKWLETLVNTAGWTGMAGSYLLRLYGSQIDFFVSRFEATYAPSALPDKPKAPAALPPA